MMMSMHAALLAPGQGSQRPGMLTPWLANDAARALLAEFSAAADMDLLYLGTQADSVTDTAVAQPLIVAAGLLSYHALGEQYFDVVAGHSVGEITALAVAGVISPSDAVGLAAVRGRAMAAAAAQQPTGMSAIVGGTWHDVLESIATCGAHVANVNSTTQVVAAGTLAQLAQLAASPPARARVIPLDVAGAFHTTHMAPAVAPVRAALAQLTPHDPQIRLLSNADGKPVTSGAAALERIALQMTAPVRWDLCQEQLHGARYVVELAPAGVLSGLAKRSIPEASVVSISEPDDIAPLHTLLTGGAA